MWEEPLQLCWSESELWSDKKKFESLIILKNWQYRYLQSIVQATRSIARGWLERLRCWAIVQHTAYARWALALAWLEIWESTSWEHPQRLQEQISVMHVIACISGWYIIYGLIYERLIMSSASIMIVFNAKSMATSTGPFLNVGSSMFGPKDAEEKQTTLLITKFKPITTVVTWWLIPLSKWVIAGVINGISRVNPLRTGVITHLLSGMSHQVPSFFHNWVFKKIVTGSQVTWMYHAVHLSFICQSSSMKGTASPIWIVVSLIHWPVIFDKNDTYQIRLFLSVKFSICWKYHHFVCWTIVCIKPRLQSCCFTIRSPFKHHCAGNE